MERCQNCAKSFEVTKRDLAFYQQISPRFNDQLFSIPPPRACPLCRAQQRMVWRGELHLFKRKCDSSSESILTFYPPEANCKIYKNEEWWSDRWDPLSFGRDFDFTRPFFEQFQELVKDVPLLARSTQNNGDNTEYTNCASWNRNCYLIAGANYNEDCYYGNYINNSKNCLDCNFIDRCELCYECIDCRSCFNLRYSFNCSGCSDSYFLSNCRNCQHCFGSINLVNKQCYYFNKPCTKPEYLQLLSAHQLNSRSGVRKAWQSAETHRLRFPHRYLLGEMNEHVSGNGINNCRNSFSCFDVSNLEDCSYCTWLHNSRDCMDILAWGFSAELCYQCMEAGDNSYLALFTVSSYGSKNVLYCYYPMYSEHCFGCVGVKRAKYCVLNKQYSKQEYERLVARIIRHMEQTKEWGEFFPVNISPLCYNTAVSQDYLPLTKDEVVARGWRWHEEKDEESFLNVDEEVPDSIDKIDQSICERVLKCQRSGKPYRIIRKEFQFYKNNDIPFPDVSFFVRHQDRLKRRNPRQIWQAGCRKCGVEISTSYGPGCKEIVYCESCYQQELV